MEGNKDGTDEGRENCCDQDQDGNSVKGDPRPQSQDQGQEEGTEDRLDLRLREGQRLRLLVVRSYSVALTYQHDQIGATERV